MAVPTAAPTPCLPGESESVVFGWTRFWVPPNLQITMSGGWDGSAGFLADPEDRFLGKYNNPHLQATGSLLACQPGCVVLCGEPGMGKSQTLRSHFAALPEANVLHIEFRDVPDTSRFERVTVGTTRWAAWRAGRETLTVVVDGVDEGLIKIAGFVDYLASLLRGEPIDRLQLILACRSLEWPRSEGRRLSGLWPTTAVSGIYELCPLRERDARLAAEMVLPANSRRTVDAFMLTVRRHQLFGLATRPLTLRMLLREFQDGGRFSRTHRELYRRFGHHLCEEPDEARRQRLRNHAVERLHVPPDRRVRIAGRIAALLLVCGRSAICPGSPANAAKSDLDLSVAEVCAGPERQDGVEFTVTPAMVEAVLESALFWPLQNGRAGFYHQTFAESFAAEYLADLPFPQKRALLCRRDRHGEFVHPPLAELAAWMAADSEEWLAHLLAHDPETLLRTDVSAIKESSRAALVDAVLARAAAGELFDTRGLERFFHALNHPQLAAQLRPVIHGRTKNHVVRRIAFRIAEACTTMSLMEDALARLRDAADTGIHSVAAGAIDDLFDPASGVKVERFLRAKRAQPLAAGIQVSLLHALLRHGRWTLAQSLPYSERVLATRDTPGYSNILAQHAKPDDAEVLLRACLRWRGCFDSLSRYHPLVAVAHDVGLARIGEPRIRRLLARVWWRARRSYRHEDFRGSRNAAAPTLLGEVRQNVELRHRFIDDLVSLPAGPRQEHRWVLAEIAMAEDFAWLLDRAQLGSPRRRRIYAQLAAVCLNVEQHAAQLDNLLAGLDRSPELREAFAWLRVWEVAAADSQQAKKNFYEHQRWQREAEIRRQKPPPADPVEVWNRDLAALATQPPTHWMTLAHNLFYRGEDEWVAGSDRIDLRAAPGWRHHGAPARARVVEGARRLILEVPGNPQHVVGSQSDFDICAYRALYLLKDEIAGDPLLADAVRRHWLPTIFDEFSNADAHHLEMMAIGYRLDGVAMRAILREKILADAAKNEGLTLELSEFARCWDQALRDFIVELASELANPRTVGCIAEYLAEHDASGALALWRRLQAEPSGEDRVVVVTAALVNWRLFEVWDEVWPSLRAKPAIAKRVFTSFEAHGQKEFLRHAAGGAEERLADLYLYLRELFPPAEDPPTPMGRAYTPTRRMEIARLRDGLPTLLASLATDAAVDALLRIAMALPRDEALWIRQCRHEAVVACRRKVWDPPTPELVLKLVRKVTARLLTDEDDLLALVLESLGRLEHNLTRQPNSLRRDFWRPVRKGPKGRKYLSPHDEVEMSRRIVTWLQSDLATGRGITVQREVQVQWKERTDIEVRAVALAGDAVRPLEIVVEVKGCWHAAVRTGAKDQLIARYLAPAGWTHGIYLVVWTACPAWKDPSDHRKVRLKAKTLEAARAEVTEMVREFDGRASPYVVAGVVLDARL